MTTELNFAPGECNFLLGALGFNRERLADDSYLCKAVDIVGGLEALGIVQAFFRGMIDLSRPKACAELLSRVDSATWTVLRDQVHLMEKADIAALILEKEYRRKYTWLPGELTDAGG